MTAEPMTPIQAETRLAELNEQMDIATLDLARARDEETTAETAWEMARNRALLSGDCPQAGVHGGVRVTVAQQKAWVDQQVAPLYEDYRLARTARQAAADKLATLRSQVSAMQSIAGSVRASYGNSGRQPWS